MVVGSTPADTGAIVVKPGISWGAVIAGSLVSLGIWILLHTLGLGIGLTAIDPDHPESLRGVGIGTGIWSLVEPLVALFIGGLVGGMLTGALTRTSALIHGGVVWALTTMVAFLALVAVVSAIAGMATRAVGATGHMVAGSGIDMTTLESLGLSGDDLVAPINERLAAEGKPQVTAGQLEAASQDALRTSVREGRMDREVLVESLAANTNLSRRDAEDVATRIEDRWNQGAVAASHGALQAAETTGKVLLLTFFVMLLGLAAALGGAVLGASRFHRTIPRATVHPRYDEPRPTGAL